MGESLEDVKARLSAKYLGRAGIHALGIRKSRNAVYVYVSEDPSASHEAVFEELKKDAGPYSVFTVREEPPGAA